MDTVTVEDVQDIFRERGLHLGEVTTHVLPEESLDFFSSFGMFPVQISRLRSGRWRLATYRTTISGDDLQSLADNAAFYLRRIRNMAKEALGDD